MIQFDGILVMLGPTTHNNVCEPIDRKRDEMCTKKQQMSEVPRLMRIFRDHHKCELFAHVRHESVADDMIRIANSIIAAVVVAVAMIVFIRCASNEHNSNSLYHLKRWRHHFLLLSSQWKWHCGRPQCMACVRHLDQTTYIIQLHPIHKPFRKSFRVRL